VKACFISLLCGVALTGIIMLVPYEYCMDGPGRGFPFAVYSPICGAWFPVFAFDHSKIPQVLDGGGFIGDVAAWGAVAYFVRSRFFRSSVHTATHKISN
jgi:hypothetical protein